MNRNVGSMLLTAIVFAVLAIPSSPSHQDRQTANSSASSQQSAATAQKHASNQNIKLCPSCIPKSPEANLRNAIDEFYGEKSPDVASLGEAVPLPAGQTVETLIVTIPDPVETHLSLFFDRTMDALQQALTREGYLFAGATLPWDSKQHPESDDWQTRQGQLEFEHAQEEMPGLLIYRKRPTGDGKNGNPLFVLVVGETPTTGIHKDQFARALALFDSWPQEFSSGATKRLRILGPTFSGSLYSMVEVLQRLNSTNRLKKYEIYLHSGTITGRRSAAAFQKFLTRSHFDSVHFISFQENDDYGLEQFLKYVGTLGYLKKQEDCYCRPQIRNKCSPHAQCFMQRSGDLPRIVDVVLLTEDETAYGLSSEESQGPHQELGTNPASMEQFCEKSQEGSFIATLSFPRDISQLRSAYQQDFLKAESSSDQKTLPRTSLPLDLEDAGGDKDTIASYAHHQTPLSQEAVLFGIITNLKKLHPDFVIVRATNPLDELFLTRFLRKAYPKVRVVTIGADLLFEQQKVDSLLEGTLAISPYSLRPDVDRYVPPVITEQVDHVSILTFPSTFSAGVYNASLSLLECKPPRYPFETKDACPDAPPAAYHEYGWSREWRDNDSARSIARPALWLLVLGQDGYWPLARLNSQDLFSESAEPHRTLPQTEPTAKPKYTLTYHLSKDWKAFSLVVISISILFVLLCWIGSAESASELLSAFDKSPDPYRTVYLTIAAVILLTGLEGLLLPYEWLRSLDSSFLPIASAIGLLCVVILFPINLVRRQAQTGQWCFIASCSFIGIGFLLHVYYFRDYVTLSRLQHVASGVSPALPVYLLLAAFLWWCWKGLQGQALLDFRRPHLPTFSNFSNPLLSPAALATFADLTEEGNTKLIRILLSPFSGLSTFSSAWLQSIRDVRKKNLNPFRKLINMLEPPKTIGGLLWVTCRISLPVVLTLFVVFFLLDPRHPIYSLEGEHFDWAYGIGVALALFLLLTDLGRLLAGWFECRRLLRALEQLRLRRGFTDIKGFSWRPIWRLTGGPQRILAREWESWQRYLLLRGAEQKGEKPKVGVSEQNAFFASRCDGVMEFLVGKWATETDTSATEHLEVNCCAECDSEKENDVEPAADVKAAERFVCFVYLNFILTVLLRLRILAFSVAGMYVLLLLSLTSYPFEPGLAIRSFVILLLLLILAAVASVYAQVHRDPTLSRITNTRAGELGADFWLRIGGFAALPTLSLLAAQYPQIGGFLFSWLQPGLDALTK